MSTSEHGAFIRHDSAAFGDGYPVDAAIYKDCARNNLLHLADEFAQQLVCAVWRSGVELSTDAPASTSVWYPIATFGPFALRTRANGTPYPLVVRIAGFASAAHSVTFRVVVSPRGLGESMAQAATAPANVVEVSTSSTSAAWLSPSTYIATIDSDLAAAMIEEIPCSDDVSYGTPAARLACLADISVWAKTANILATPRLAGLEVREYVGL